MPVSACCLLIPRPSIAAARGDEVSARRYNAGLERWRVQEGDYGQLLIFHRHRGGAEHPAYVLDEDNDRRLAQCVECKQYVEVFGTTPAASAE
jgi:hypothetical protein